MSVAAVLENISVALGGNRILSDVSLSIEPGEFFTLLGPSGSGKTTTLNILAGFIRQSEGQLRFDDRVISNLPPRRRNIGFVFQDYALFAHMTVGENIAFPLRARSVNKRMRRQLLEEALALVRLPGMGDRKPDSLSSGQRQRVALARALVFRPSLLLLDEPLAALDKQLREAMQVELKQIQRETGVTTVCVTHDQGEALTMADRLAIMEHGRILQIGSPEEVYRRPTNVFVAKFLGDANLFGIAASGDVPLLSCRLDVNSGFRGGVGVVRPEDLVIERDRRRVAGGLCEAAVEAVVYQGMRYKIIARGGGHASVAPAQLVISVPSDGGTPFEVGEKVFIGCPPSSIHVISDVAPA